MPFLLLTHHFSSQAVATPAAREAGEACAVCTTKRPVEIRVLEQRGGRVILGKNALKKNFAKV